MEMVKEMPTKLPIDLDLTTNCEPDSPIPPNRVDTSQRLQSLREIMVQKNLQAYYVPLDEEGRRSWISGFSGSNGDAIITLDQAACWTDGRYFLQAADQLDCNWQLMRMGQDGVPTYATWILGDANLSEGSRVGANPELLGAKTWLELSASLSSRSIELVSVPQDLIDQIWTPENGRPPFKARDIVVHPMEFAGKPFEEKIDDLRNKLVEKGANAMVVSELDEIAWLLNLRGEGSSTVEGLFHSPLFQSIALVTPEDIRLWIHSEKITPDLLSHLQGPDCDTQKATTCVGLEDITNWQSSLAQWASEQTDLKVLVTKPSMYLSGASYAVYHTLPTDSVQFEASPILDAKAMKNSAEAQGMVNAHIRDAFAVCEFAAFLEDQILNQPQEIWDEIRAADKLSQLRAQQNLSKGDSFTTISASGSNAAVIHYSPVEETNALINDSAIYLLDSGGQYLDGTTDITRTFFYGSDVPSEIKEMYTRVLMGAIDLARVTVPYRTQDSSVDVLTRQHLFHMGLDFRHGTGHGIGAYLSVHEGPTRIGMGWSDDNGRLQDAMFFSDEPGYYKDGEYGIRLESIVRVVKRDDFDSVYGQFIGLETITLVPFEPKLIDFALMTPDQIQWLNSYNDKIRQTILPRFEATGNQLVVDWINLRTQRVSPTVSHWIQDWKNEL
ncbi:hypothetical protein TCAL_06265 [Tigriopus californicus]|uniref:Xaa-Pro aminopeptidase n=1 Tax=Tigriopus californicus TaxID=6832 RepID=A0A553NCW8_TIGCA|nr:hypothetical protein TCAL_06265 [Tigriopus californicus]|eukprot:TCALIF_06265-PA protein Name:"Similar to ampp Probable Xaa-Pro aminopeptidase P (Emericella nidulans (strain FGSC A4 / ATCC 38163 / CBS 112.46 / NRRL 194 / M139))" AED:0.11 eAED:0.11 QI:187/0.87/0.88/1/0.87/0.88/9/79/667